jgi:hypothetical protein
MPHIALVQDEEAKGNFSAKELPREAVCAAGVSVLNPLVDLPIAIMK